MATPDQRLITEAALHAYTSQVFENTAVGRVTLHAPSGHVTEIGDTGWIDIRGSMTNGWTADVMKIRRTGNTVRLRFSNLNATAATSTYFITLPTGYYSPGSRNYLYALSNLDPGSFWISNGRLSSRIESHMKTSVEQELTMPLDGQAWPTSLGGEKL